MDVEATRSHETEKIFVAFLFDADHELFIESYNYGSPCKDAFLRALAKADKHKSFQARIRRGDVLAHQIASKLARLVIVPRSLRPPNGGTARLMEYRTDHRTLATVAGDIVDYAKQVWSTANLADLGYRLAGANVYCLSAHPVPLSLAQAIDKQLSNYAPYLGAIELDGANPLHIRLFSNLLDCIYIDGRTVYASRWDTDEGVYEFGEDSTGHFQLIEMPYFDFQQAAPCFPRVKAYSERGELSQSRLHQASRDSHFEKVASELTERALNGDDNLEVDLRISLPAEDQLEVPAKKLLGYALNIDHNKGKHKARLFSDLLGIDADHWRYLAYQIMDEVRNAKLNRVRVTEHGIQYDALLPVAGPNGRTLTIETAWIIRSEGPAQLVTAFPASKDKQVSDLKGPPPFIPDDGNEVSRLKKIFLAAREAGEQASIASVPTPMQIVGFGVELEGLCGGARVRLDGRSKFARWLVQEGHARKSNGSGVEFHARTNSQSKDRAEAYAKAFARVLWLNKIDGAIVETYLS